MAGLVAAGADLSVQRLREAYSQGIFPWFSKGQPVLWWSPDPRMVLHTKDFKLHRSFRKTLVKFCSDSTCAVRINTAFEEVIHGCAHSKRQGQHGTWIVPVMIEAYTNLHRAGLAHSVETWVNGKLVGGLYCVCIGRALFGESMFAFQTDASKIALAGLVAFARAHGLTWIDCQQNTPHLSSLGAKEMKRGNFAALLRDCTDAPVMDWQFHDTYWIHILPNGKQPDHAK